MLKKGIFLGGMLAFGVGFAGFADPIPPNARPIAREDVVQVRLLAQAEAMKLPRPSARPDYMLRYPAVIATWEPAVRPVPRPDFIPRARWDGRPGSVMWTRAAMSAMAAQGAPLAATVPRDIDNWCPAYRTADREGREAFWVGMMSALAKHESTMNPQAVGGGGLWYGLLQILPDTARRYGCHARTAEDLTDPESNLACAARIMAVTVPRDGAVAVHDGRWRGVAADWGPMTNRSKIAEMSSWTRAQSYCVPQTVMRPKARPAGLRGSIREAQGDPIGQVSKADRS